MCATTYALGHSSTEIERLKNQGDMLRPITERLLRNAGIDAGMRVLDLGCGAGDVSMLAAELVDPAGFVVGKSIPHVPLWDLTSNLVRIALQFSVPNHDGADRLVQHFSEAGLPYPTLFSEELVGGTADSPLYGSLAALLQTLQPQLEKMRIMTAETVAMDGLESRLRDAVINARSQVYGPAQVCAWARL